VSGIGSWLVLTENWWSPSTFPSFCPLAWVPLGLRASRNHLLHRPWLWMATAMLSDMLGQRFAQ
jgi:hypothetical protein